jgi:hypothetical protein
MPVQRPLAMVKVKSEQRPLAMVKSKITIVVAMHSCSHHHRHAVKLLWRLKIKQKRIVSRLVDHLLNLDANIFCVCFVSRKVVLVFFLFVFVFSFFALFVKNRS